MTLTPLWSLFSLTISSFFLFLTPEISSSVSSGRSFSSISRLIIPSSIFVLYTFTELNRLDPHNFFIALLSYSPGILIASTSLSPENLIIVRWLNDLLPETSISPILYLSTLFCECVDSENKKTHTKTKSLDTRVKSFTRFCILFNLFTSFSKSSFSILITNYSFIQIFFSKVGPHFTSKI